MICRFYEPTKGEILINDEDYKMYSIASIRNRIGYVMQDVQILPNTIVDNIKYVNESITLLIYIVIQMYCLVGEKQMINFARVMAINPDVIILDEVTSALSFESEMLVRNAVREVSEGKIAIIVAHRLSTVSECGKVISMKEGKILL